MNQKNKKKRRSPKTPTRKNTRKHPKQDNSASTNSATRWLLLLSAVLLAGLGARYFLSVQTTKRIADAKAAVQRARQSGNWSDLESAANTWIALAPDAYEPWQAISEAAAAQGNPDVAAQCIQEYIDSTRKKPELDAYLDLGYLQMEDLGDPVATNATLDQTLEAYPNDTETHQRRLYYLLMTCQRNAIRTEVERAIANDCDSLASYVYLFAAKWMTFSNGFPTNQRWLQRYPDDELFQVASVLHLPSYPFLDLLAKEQNPDATDPRPLEFFAQSVAETRKLHPENLELLAVEIQQLCQTGETEEVHQRLALQLPGMADDNRFWRYKGWHHAALSQNEASEQAYRQALQLEPWDWNSQLELAALLRSTEGLAASQTMQKNADLGRQLVAGIKNNQNLYELEPRSLYDDLANYFELCNATGMAQRLRQRLGTSSEP